jgi:hypothetical protein
VAFGFGATDGDYPGLGQGLYVSESGGFVTVKWLPDSKTGFINVADIKDATSDEHHTVTLDVDLGSGAKREHLKGTITCP